jgi:formyl-CoA transferase
MFAPLKGRKVIDLTQVLAGPYCSYQLGLLGADVIKIEPQDGGDWARIGGRDAALSDAGLAAGFLTQNAGKRSIAIDLKQPKGVALVLDMVGQADVFLENFRPGTAARLGLDVATVQGRNPSIVYASLSAYGQDGPMGGRPAYDHVIQAVSGIMQLTGDPETLPNKVGAPYVDYATGMNGAFAVLSALMEKDRTGKGQRVDVAMLDSALLLMASHMTGAATSGTIPQASGNEAFSGSPTSGVFKTKHGDLALAANNERQYPRLLQAIGREDLATDPRFADRDAKKANAPALRQVLAETFLTDTADAWEEKLSAADVPAGRVRDIGDAMNSPQVQQRGLMQEYEISGTDRKTQAPTLGFKANGSMPAAKSPAPRLGADADSVLKDFGMRDAAIAALRTSGVVL